MWPEPVIGLERLRVGYGNGVDVLTGLNLDVHAGEVVGLVGGNGAGKTTLVRATGGLLAFHDGQIRDGAVRVLGLDITVGNAPKCRRRGLATVLSGRRLFAALTVEEHVRLAAGGRRAGRCAFAEAFVMFPVLASRGSTPVGHLSGGEQQMVAIACAFAARPRALVLDEPTVGLAPHVVGVVVERVRRLAADGAAVLVIEHDATAVADVADRVVELVDRTVRPARSGLVASQSGGRAAGRRRRTIERSMPRLALAEVSYRAGGVRILDGVDLEIGSGRKVGVVGPNGAGKTSLLDVISGFARYQHGAVTIAGRRLPAGRALSAALAGVARTFQQPAVFGGLSVEDNLLAATHGRRSRDLDTVACALQLEPVWHVRSGSLPSGVQKRVDIARAILRRPQVMLVDEPTAGLSQAESELVASAITELVDSTGAAAMVVDHDGRFLGRLCDDIVAMDRGAIVA